jgi:hypothetical protein
MGRGGARLGAGRKRKTLLELVKDGTFYAKKSKHRELLRADDTLVQAVDIYPALEPLLEIQLLYCEAAEGNPQWATSLAHRFEAEVRRLGREGLAFGRGLVTL